MRLKHDINLGYCTNIHRGETWAETFGGLSNFTNEVRKRVAPDRAYGVGLRLSSCAASQLATDSAEKDRFRHWLEDTNSYLFTINGFPYGTFHGSRVKEQVYVPDWRTPERLDYTNLLFDLLSEMAPEGEEISVSTLPGSFKEFIAPESEKEALAAMRKHLIACCEHIEGVRETTGRDVHLGMEPEPLGYFETSRETVEFFERICEGMSSEEEERFRRNIGVNYDTCHLALEYESPGDAVENLLNSGIRISKVHLSSALRLKPETEAVERLGAFDDEVYLHQVIVWSAGKVSHRFRDLPEALSWYRENREQCGEEWRVHFHIPIHSRPESVFLDTRDHISGLLDLLSNRPDLCRHFEMETYTWEVLPAELRSSNVVDQLVAEYDWCLGEFGRHGLA